MKFSQYMYLLGERLGVDGYDYSNTLIFENLDYFRDCHKSGLSAYKSLTFFPDHLETKDNDSKE